MSIKDIMLALFVAFIWASAYLVQKELVNYVPAYLTISIEALIIAIFFIPFFLKPIILLKDNLILSFLWGVGTYGSILTAARLGIDVSVAVVIGKLNVIFSIIFSVIFCKEKIGFKAVVGIVIAFSGMLLLLNTPNVLEKPLAFIFVILFTIFWGLYNVYVKYKFMESKYDLNPIALVAWVALFSFPQTMLMSYFFDDWGSLVMDYHSVLYILFLSIANSVGLSVWFSLLQRNPVQKVAPFALFVPIIGLAEAYFFSHEVITMFHIFAVIFIVSGVYISIRDKSHVMQ